MSGVVQDMDSYMMGKIGQREYYDKVPAALQRAMDEYYELTGRRYDMVMPYRLEDAEYAHRRDGLGDGHRHRHRRLPAREEGHCPSAC